MSYFLNLETGQASNYNKLKIMLDKNIEENLLRSVKSYLSSGARHNCIVQ